MKSLFTRVTGAVIVVGLMGCATMGGGVSRQDVGTAMGAVTGGVIGSQFGQGSGKTATTIGGAVVGGYIGRQLSAPSSPNQ